MSLKMSFKINKRRLFAMLVLLLVLTSAMPVAAEDIILSMEADTVSVSSEAADDNVEQIIAEGGETSAVIETEATHADEFTSGLIESNDEKEEEMVIAVDALEELQESALSYGEDAVEEQKLAEETIEGMLSPSGLASEAMLSPFMSFTLGIFPGNYGGQLSDDALLVYNLLKAAYIDRGETGKTMVVFSAPYSFRVQGTVESGGKLKWDKEENADYLFTNESINYALQAAYDAFIYDYPQVYWMGNVRYGYNISYYTNSGGSYTGMITSAWLFPYEAYYRANTIDEREKFTTAVNQAVSDIQAAAGGDADRYMLVKEIHDWVCGRTSYKESIYAHSAGGILLHASAGVVCESYAKTVKVLCDSLGIDCILVVGMAGEAHMWNYIKMEDGNWYLLDATWDDDDGTFGYDYFLLGSTSTDAYGSFLVANRLLYTNFSMAECTHTFEYPVCSSQRYSPSVPVHRHIWKLMPEYSKEPACTEKGVYVYECTCKDRSIEYTDKLGHSYIEKKYEKNIDGSVSWVCDRGCGNVKLTMDLQFNVNSLLLKKGQTTRKLKLSFSNGDTVVKCVSGNPSIVEAACSLDGVCTVKAGKTTGTTYLTFTLKSGVEKRISVTVQKKTVKTTAITGVPAEHTMKKGAKYELQAVPAPITSGQKITYSSTRKRVATVSKKGIVKARSKGTATIKIKSGNITVKCKIKVK